MQIPWVAASLHQMMNDYSGVAHATPRSAVFAVTDTVNRLGEIEAPTRWSSAGVMCSTCA